LVGEVEMSDAYPVCSKWCQAARWVIVR
jgi:hypothetical protein